MANPTVDHGCPEGTEVLISAIYSSRRAAPGIVATYPEMRLYYYPTQPKAKRHK